MFVILPETQKENIKKYQKWLEELGSLLGSEEIEENLIWNSIQGRDNLVRKQQTITEQLTEAQTSLPLAEKFFNTMNNVCSQFEKQGEQVNEGAVKAEVSVNLT